MKRQAMIVLVVLCLPVPPVGATTIAIGIHGEHDVHVQERLVDRRVEYLVANLSDDAKVIEVREWEGLRRPVGRRLGPLFTLPAGRVAVWRPDAPVPDGTVCLWTANGAQLGLLSLPDKPSPPRASGACCSELGLD